MRELHMVTLAILGVSLATTGLGADAGGAGDPHSGVSIRSFVQVRPVARAQRDARVEAVVENRGEAAVSVRASLLVPDGVTARNRVRDGVRIAADDGVRLAWDVVAAKAGRCDLGLKVEVGGRTIDGPTLSMNFLAPVQARKLAYIPEPEPVQTSMLVGAHNCPLWETGAYNMWAQVVKHPERTPVLGFYGQENPEVADWETKWATEHGVSFFIYCWYRASQGGPVKTNFGSAIHDALLKSRFRSKMKFTIMWENQSRGVAGVSDEKDLMQNLLPFWIENYFKDPSYVKVDNKPLLFIYRPEFLVDDLGGEANVRAAFDKMREVCRKAGFGGLYILGEYRGLDPDHLAQMKRLGLDYTFAYCWHVPNSPTPQQAVDAQVGYIRKTQGLGVIPQVVTVSQAWSGWADEGSIWKIPPKEFEGLLRWARDFASTLPKDELGSKLLLLDNWNEWGEGHYIAPYREYGFGYLDAVRKVFANAPERHTDLIPEDIGMGPYDTAFVKHARRTEDLRAQASRKVLKPGAEEDGLVGWWTFDEKDGSPVALDYSGHRLGGWLKDATRAPGVDGRALVCSGGSVIVENNPLLSLTSGLTVECWVKTDVAGQGNNWILNRVFSGGVSTGYRLGVLDGCPCFEVPQTDWSHHLKADTPIPLGRWTHIAGTFDGRTMRIYVDGRECGSMERPGPAKANEFHLCLGNYELDHPSYFRGLIDEVKLYNRALTPDEVRAHHARLAVR